MPKSSLFYQPARQLHLRSVCVCVGYSLFTTTEPAIQSNWQTVAQCAGHTVGQTDTLPVTLMMNCEPVESQSASYSVRQSVDKLAYITAGTWRTDGTSLAPVNSPWSIPVQCFHIWFIYFNTGSWTLIEISNRWRRFNHTGLSSSDYWRSALSLEIWFNLKGLF